MRKGVLLGLGVMALSSLGMLAWTGCGSSSSPAGGGPDGSVGNDGMGGPDTSTGSDSPGGGDGSAQPDASTDSPTPPPSDAGMNLPVDCPTQPCGGGMSCCVLAGDAGATDGGPSVACLATCPGGLPVDCRGPSNCGGGTPLCCGTVDLTGTFPMCTVQSASTMCGATCQEMLTPSCGVQYARMCTVGSDCIGAANMNSLCCTIPQAPGIYACINSTDKTILGATCVP